MTPDARLRELLAGQLAHQSRACAELGSPLYAGLLARAAEDAAAGGPVWEVLRAEVHEGSGPRGSALPLRFMAAVHRLVLTGRAPILAAFYPSAGGAEGAGARDALRQTVEDHVDALREDVRRPCQTNEVGRSAPLVGGFLAAAERLRLPFRLLEVGASAGLNLRWDRFRYESPAAAWGDPGSSVVLRDAWENAPPALDAPVEVVERRGCDLHPIDPTTEEGALALTSSVWADQRDRLARLRGAIEIARSVPAQVDREPAATWVPARLAEPAPGLATVLYHSVVWQYIAPEDRAAIESAIRAAGERATDRAPVAWVRMEPEDDPVSFEHVVTV
ncbi:MAG: DUF2332 domain-containing protein, partial [Actinobacteria bacterium]|nr:DUF2332 domain-containing protein [Actinomycetota bacterium]